MISLESNSPLIYSTVPPATEPGFQPWLVTLLSVDIPVISIALGTTSSIPKTSQETNNIFILAISFELKKPHFRPKFNK